MRVRIHPADHGGCGKYRLTWPGEAVRGAGHDAEVIVDYSYQAKWVDGLAGPRVVALEERVDHDVIVFQRPLHRNRVEFLRALKAEGVAVVVEIDDDFHAIHRQNAAWKHVNPLFNRDKNRDWLMIACNEADLVTVSTPALAERYGRHGRCVILPNYVPERYVHTNGGPYTKKNLRKLGGVVVGWSGSTLTHPGDLEACDGAFDGYEGPFQVVGTGKGVKNALGLAHEPAAMGWLPIEAYPEGLRMIDVGLAPLEINAFNEAKSWLKGLEYASLGIPFVASPTGPYRDLAERGIGFLAEGRDDWRAKVDTLVHDDEFRTATGAEWRAQVADEFTIERHVEAWWDAWSLAVENASRREAA